jgi:hypothetical protein
MKKIIITRTSYLVPCNELLRPPGVRRCWLLPREFTLVELDDPVFETVHTLYAPSSSQAAAILQEAALFAPYYRQARSLADVSALKILTKTVTYHLVLSSRILLRWPGLMLIQDWDTVQPIQLTCRFLQMSSRHLGIFEQIVEEWQVCMRRLGVIGRFDRVPGATPTTVECQFIHSGEEATLALFMMLSSARFGISLGSLNVCVSANSNSHENNANQLTQVNSGRPLEDFLRGCKPRTQGPHSPYAHNDEN